MTIQPMLCMLIDKPFDDAEWLFEIKMDGFRAIAELNGKKVKLYSRNRQSFNERFPHIVDHLASLKLHAILDGEIAAVDDEGVSHFQMLQHYATAQHIYYFVFDILYLNGRDLRELPLIERKAILKKVLGKDPLIHYLDHVEKRGKEFFELCKQHGLEGVIGKKREGHYHEGERLREWVKIKVEQRQEVVICGYTSPKKSRKHFGALVVGVYHQGELHYAGHVGGGFTEKKLEEIKKLLSPYVTARTPLKKAPKLGVGVTWVKPELRCEVKFKEWTNSGTLRMPIFLGLRSRAKYDFITHPEKILWEKEKITKRQLLNYYEAVSHFLLPYLKERPESLKRYPNGAGAPAFFQKNIRRPPEWAETVLVEHSNKTVNYLIIQDVKSLLYAVNLGCLEIHPWLSRVESLGYPDFLIFDLDPEAISFDAVIETALALHAILDGLGIPNFCKTSGGRGMHIGVPLKAQYSYTQAKQFAELVAIIVHRKLPKITSLERSPKKRQKKVYIDCYQNNFGQTLAAPFSVRAKAGAPVSTPLDWSEVVPGILPSDFHFFNTLERLQRHRDPFKGVLGRGINLVKTIPKLELFVYK